MRVVLAMSAVRFPQSFGDENFDCRACQFVGAVAKGAGGLLICEQNVSVQIDH
jgi:hypothetical protein